MEGKKLKHVARTLRTSLEKYTQTIVRLRSSHSLNSIDTLHREVVAVLRVQISCKVYSIHMEVRDTYILSIFAFFPEPFTILPKKYHNTG